MIRPDTTVMARCTTGRSSAAPGSDAATALLRRTASAAGLPAVTLVLPTRDRPDMARDAIRSVLLGHIVPDEILVVDQSVPALDLPSLGLADPVDDAGCRVRVVSCAPGLSRAVNVGIRVARHDAVAVVHDDVVVTPEWLANLIGPLARAGRGTVVTGRVAATDPERPGAFAPALRDDPDPAVHVGRVDRCVIRPMNIAVWRDDHLQVGGYDDRLGPGTSFPGGEDHDYSVRLLEAGFTVRYEPDALVRHRAWRDRRRYLPLRWSYGTAHGAFYARSYDPSDRFVLQRAAKDVRRRLRLVPRALVTEPRVGIGHLVFLAATPVGAVRWRRRYGSLPSRPASAARPIIAPVDHVVARPKWSVMIPAHNCARYLGDTLRGVLAQDDGEMQIEVVDDHSTRDDPEAVVHAVGGGRVGYHRHEVNRGNIATFNTCLARSTGRYVHILHGDDLVLPGFYERLGRALDDEPRCVAAICGHVLVDDAGDLMRPMPALADRPGILPDFLERILGGNLIQAPSIVVRRDAYEAVGGFDDRIGTYAEDWEMWTRLAAIGPVWYDPDVLAAYRVRSGSISSSVGSRSLADMRRVVAINRATVEGVVPAGIARRRERAARQWASTRIARRALRSIDRGRTAQGLSELGAALVTSPTPRILLVVPAVPYRLLMREVNRRRPGSDVLAPTGGSR